ncbi:hypothetical protein M3Y98_00248800 [Aphelenchoides besseyi]|nr:hypothetical protein M3Y98_00248800 [Aphelenchoides besseyi]KAI6200748.1 hypothetical protein M3Y96_00767000 [Aphelenchoides besseyi]
MAAKAQIVCVALFSFTIILASLELADASPLPFNQLVGSSYELSTDKRTPIFEGEQPPRVLNHLLKQPILSFGSWFGSMGRNKRQLESISNINDAELENKIDLVRRALLNHQRLLLRL